MQDAAPTGLPRRAARSRRRGGRYAGAIASFSTAIIGIVFGAVFAYLAGRGAVAEATRDAPALRETAALPDGLTTRARLVEALQSDSTLDAGNERLGTPVSAPTGERPKIILIFDDVGPDRAAFETLMALPGPLTLSFLPYAPNIAPLVERARAGGHAVMLHLPMEPAGRADPGPHALRVEMTGSALLQTLEWNLSRFEGYIGVNNHMGSRFTRDEAAMKTVLSVLDRRGLFFLDSLTTGKSVAAKAGAAVGARVYARDVFVDPQAGRSTVVRQLALVERIALETGYAVAIAHPRAETLAAIGPWLTSAPARGFELATVEALDAFGDAVEDASRVAAIGGR